MQILNVQLIFYFIFVGVFCFVFPEELTGTKLGKWYLGANAFFWFARTIQQFMFLRGRHPIIHVLTAVFIIGILLFILPLTLGK